MKTNLINSLKDLKIFPLGGINKDNLNKLKIVHSDGFAINV